MIGVRVPSGKQRGGIIGYSRSKFFDNRLQAVMYTCRMINRDVVYVAICYWVLELLRIRVRPQGVSDILIRDDNGSGTHPFSLSQIQIC